MNQTLQANGQGSTTLRLKTPTGAVRVTVDPDVEHATISFPDLGADAARKVIGSARVSEDRKPRGDLVWSVELTDVDGADGPDGPETITGPQGQEITFGPGGSVRITGPGGSVRIGGRAPEGIFIGGDSYGTVTTGSVGGSVIIGGRGAAPAPRIDVRLPAGSSIALTGDAVSLNATGRLRVLAFRTGGSGDVQATEVERLRAETVSGHIMVGSVSGQATANTVSGSISIDSLQGAAMLRAVSGSITVDASGPGSVQASTVSGSITVRAPQALVDSEAFTCSTHTVSGHVRAPRASGVDVDFLD